MEYEIQRCTRHCATTGRELLPGEPFYSTIVARGAELVRQDYAAEAWKGPPDGVLGWWKSQMPDPRARRAQLAPNDVILELFDQLAEQPDKQEMRYVLALLLVRRRVMRQEDTEQDEAGGELMVAYCPRREATYRVPVAPPSPEHAEEIQRQLATLLFAEGSNEPTATKDV
jgi:hypothetical protein